MKLSTKEKFARIIDAMLYGDFTTKKYLYGILIFTLIMLVTGIMAAFGAGIWYGLVAMLVGVVDLIWWQSMTLTEGELKEQGDKVKKKKKRRRQKKRQERKKKTGKRKSL